MVRIGNIFPCLLASTARIGNHLVANQDGATVLRSGIGKERTRIITMLKKSAIAVVALGMLAASPGMLQAYWNSPQSYSGKGWLAGKAQLWSGGAHFHGPLYNYGPYNTYGHYNMFVPYPWIGQYNPAYPANYYGGYAQQYPDGWNTHIVAPNYSSFLSPPYLNGTNNFGYPQPGVTTSEPAQIGTSKETLPAPMPSTPQPGTTPIPPATTAPPENISFPVNSTGRFQFFRALRR